MSFKNGSEATLPAAASSISPVKTRCGCAEGFGAEEDGGLKFIPGSHLWRAPGRLVGATDAALAEGWLRGKAQ